MKKPGFTILSLLLCLTLCACAGADGPVKADAPVPAPERFETREPSPGPSDGEPEALPEVNFPRETADGLLKRILPTVVSDEEKVRLAYVYLIENTYFAEPVGLDIWFYRSGQVTPPDFAESRSISPLLFGVGSCEDFACAMVILLEQMGFSARYVPGFTLSVDGEYVDHAWAVAEIGGAWYHLDPQLEQNIVKDGVLRYRYFLKSDEDMMLDHKWGENLIEHFPDIPPEDIAAIRELYTPPECPQSAPQLQSHEVSLPRRPDLERLIEAIEREKRESPRYPERDKAGPVIAPPVLIHQYGAAAGMASSPGYLQYGREFLSPAAKILYDDIFASASRLEIGGSLPLPPGCPAGEAASVIEYFLSDNPRFYWLRPALTENGAAVRLDSALAADEISARERELEAAAKLFWADIPGAAHPADAVAALHDRLAASIAYDTTLSAEDNANIYGGLVRGRAVCDGFSKSLQYLLQQRGVDCVYIRGTSPRGAAHSWNAWRTDKGWYYTDVTWDAPRDKARPVPHDYLNITRAEMDLEHYYDARQYPSLPESGDTEWNYYARNGYAVYPGGGAGTVESLAAAFTANLKDKQLPREPAPVFLEVKVFGTPEEYRRVKDEYVRGLFAVLAGMREIIEREKLPIRLETTGSVECNFNDAMQILILYPQLEAAHASRQLEAAHASRQLEAAHASRQLEAAHASRQLEAAHRLARLV